MTDSQPRPWLELYQGVPPAIEPLLRRRSRCSARPSQRDRGATLVHYFDRPLTRGAVRLDVGRACRGLAAARRGARQPHCDVPAERAAGADHGACRLEVRRRDRAVQPDAARARARARSCRARGAACWCARRISTPTSRRRPCRRRPSHTSITTSPLEFLDRGRSAADRIVGRDAAAASARRRSADARRGARADRRPQPVEIDGDDVAFMVYTSGTTGDPKGAMNTHRNVVFATPVYEHWIGLTRADTILGLAPLFHVTGLIGHVTLAMLDRQPARAVLSIRRERGLPAGRAASGHVHGLGDHGVHRAAQ